MIGSDDIKKMIQLSKLDLPSDEEEALGNDLKEILNFVEKLQEVNLDGVEATSHAVEMNNVFREDEVVISPAREEALHQAPQLEEEQIVVPRVI